MIDTKAKNVKIFNDTLKRCKNGLELKEAVQQSIQRQTFIGARAVIVIPEKSLQKKATVIVSEKRSLEAAMPYAAQGKKFAC